MALVERLMHIPEDDPGNIAVHEFFAALVEMLNGQLTAAQIQSYYSMSADDITEWNALAATIPASGQTAARAIWLEHIHAAFILAEHRVPLYSTPTEVRTRLGI